MIMSKKIVDLAKVEKIEIELLGQKYIIPKPNVLDLMDIEDDSRDEYGNIDDYSKLQNLLHIVSLNLNAKDFVKFNKVKLTFGEINLECVEDISYNEWVKPFKERKIRRTEYARIMLRLCGIKGELSDYGFTFNQIDEMAMAYLNLYNKDEIEEVCEFIKNTCFPECR